MRALRWWPWPVSFSAGVTITKLMDPAQLPRRLRSLGEGSPPTDVAARHIASIYAARPRRAAGWGTGLAAVFALLGATGGLALIARTEPASVPPRAPIPDVAPPTGQGEPPTDDPCVGPPPFAGVEPVSEEARAAEADEFSEFRETQCPDDADERGDGDDDGDGGPPLGGDPCVGPPPFAGVEPVSEEARAAEAEEFSEFRETQCPDDADGEAGAPPVGEPGCAGPPSFAGVDAGDGLARAAEAGALAAQQAACGADRSELDAAVEGPGSAGAPPPVEPPDGSPTTPPVSLPVEPPVAPPDDTPDGPSEGTPDGPSEGTPDGPPEGTPDGPPEGTPDGPPEDVPGPARGGG